LDGVSVVTFFKWYHARHCVECAASYHSKFVSREIFAADGCMLECGTEGTAKFLLCTYTAWSVDWRYHFDCIIFFCCL